MSGAQVPTGAVPIEAGLCGPVIGYLTAAGVVWVEPKADA